MVEIPPRDGAAGGPEALPELTAGATKDSIILADFINHTGDPGL